MSDTVVETEASDLPTLYYKIVEIVEFEPEEGESVEEFKARVVRHMDDVLKDDADDVEFHKYPVDVQKWLALAGEVMVKNRGARKKAPLPAMEGLDDTDEEEDKPKKRGRPAKDGTKKSGYVKKGRNPEANSHFRVADLLCKNPDMSIGDVEEALEKAGHTYGVATLLYSMESFKGVCLALKKHGMLNEKHDETV